MMLSNTGRCAPCARPSPPTARVRPSPRPTPTLGRVQTGRPCSDLYSNYGDVRVRSRAAEQGVLFGRSAARAAASPA